MDDWDSLNGRLGDDARALLGCLPSDGAPRGNAALRLQLGWDEDRYLAARNELLDAGLVRKWTGRGGTIKRIVDWDVRPSVSADEGVAKAEFEAEQDLYMPVAEQLRLRWAKDMRLEPSVVSILGLQGRRRTGGRWSRPDITLVAVQQFDLIPGKHIEVVTFEVKLGPALDVAAVYEALAHRRAASQAYVVVHSIGLLEDALSIVEDEARRHGIGLILFEDPLNYDTWETRIEAEQLQADPRALNSFLSTQLPAKDRETVARLVR